MKIEEFEINKFYYRSKGVNCEIVLLVQSKNKADITGSGVRNISTDPFFQRDTTREIYNSNWRLATNEEINAFIKYAGKEYEKYLTISTQDNYLTI